MAKFSINTGTDIEYKRKPGIQSVPFKKVHRLRYKLNSLEAVSSPHGVMFVHSPFITSDDENSHKGCMCEYLKVSTPIKIPHRINELRRDDEVQAKVHREINHEREMTSAIQMSQSWDEHFSLVSLALASHQTNLNTGCICLIHSREDLM